jgi:trehalose synthase
VADDPEGSAVFAQVVAAWRALPDPLRRRVHLVNLPMDDVEENAVIVNALQRHAAVVAQKSLVEGFGLTVSEAMWKARPVVASAIGGILDQVVDGETGLLVQDPTDQHEFGDAVIRLLGDLGEAAHLTVVDRYLGDRHLIQYADMFATMLGHAPAPSGP